MCWEPPWTLQCTEVLLRLVQAGIFSTRPLSTKLMPTLQNWTGAGLSNTLVHYRVCGGSQCIGLERGRILHLENWLRHLSMWCVSPFRVSLCLPAWQRCRVQAVLRALQRRLPPSCGASAINCLVKLHMTSLAGIAARAFNQTASPYAVMMHCIESPCEMTQAQPRLG